MNQDIKDQWISALWSGEYPQTTGWLNVVTPAGEGDDAKPAGYCCLGVLCELAVEAGIAEKRTKRAYVYYNEEPAGPEVAVYAPPGAFEKAAAPGLAEGSETSVLPPFIRDWAGLSSSNPDVDLGVLGTAALAELNDGYKLDFDRIASAIGASEL